MNIKYDEFNSELEKKVKVLTDWLKEIEPGYEGEIDKEAFMDLKNEILGELDVFVERTVEDFGEYLED